jgi:hypothetical protein
MKLILAATLFATLAAPVAAPAQPAMTAFEEALSQTATADRRSGTCPRRGAGGMREGSTCGGV